MIVGEGSGPMSRDVHGWSDFVEYYDSTSFSSNIDHANTEEGLLFEQSQHSIGLVGGLL